MKLNDIKISYKLMLGFALMIILTLIVGIVGYNALSKTNTQSDLSSRETNLIQQGLALDAIVQDYILTGNQAYVDQFHGSVSVLKDDITYIETNFDLTQQELMILDSLSKDIDTYSKTFDSYTGYVASNNEVFVKWKAIGDGFNTQIASLRQKSVTGDSVYLQSDITEVKFVLMRVAAYVYIKTQTDATWESFTNSMTVTKNEAKKLAALTVNNPEQNIAANQILTYIDSYADASAIYRNNDLQKAAAYAQLDKIIDKMHGSSEKSNTNYGGEELLVNIASDKSALAQKSARMLIISFVISAFIVGIILAIIITKLIVKPMRTIIEETKKLADTGDLNLRVPVSGRDEIGELGLAINEMLENTAAPVRELSNVAESISKGDLTVKIDVTARGDVAKLVSSMTIMTDSLKEFVNHVSMNANVSATSAEELSASAEEVNASSEQVSSTIQEIARGGQNLTKLATEAKDGVISVGEASRFVSQNAQKAAEGANNAGKAADSGMQAGLKAGDVMKQILISTQTTSKDIRELDEKSKQISKIVDVINRISEQTNLLALNAAIEAARAGEAGRGFAVVADEVRKLAEESQKATTQIEDMIASIQVGTKKSVDGMNLSAQTVEDGTIIVDQALRALTEIATIAKTVGSQAQDVSAAAQETTASVDKVIKAIQEVSAVAEESAAGTQEVSASMEQTVSSMTQVSNAAQSLAKGADELRQLISKYNVGSASADKDFDADRKKRSEEIAKHKK